MKKLFITILSLFSVAVMSMPTEAQDFENPFELNSPSQNGNRSRKFVLQGHVDPNIADSCYNIYITNLNGKITSADFVTRVPVKNKTFRFETELDEIKSGRIRALFPGDKLCSAWIETYFIPGFTLDMTVHNGYYDINNLSQYNAAASEWIRYYPQQPPVFNSESNHSVKEDESVAKLKAALDAYQELLEELQNELNMLDAYNLTISVREKQANKLFKKMSKITDSMEKLISKYVQAIEK